VEMTYELFQKIHTMNVSITEEKILERLRDTYRWPKQYLKNVSKNWNYDSDISVKYILKDGCESSDIYDENDYLDYSKTLSLYEQGYTLVIGRVQYLNDEIRRITDVLTEALGEVTANIYFGKGTSSVSFPDHVHPYPVIVKSVYGHSDWVLDNETHTLKDQDALYFTEHVVHRVDKIFSPKLSITFNLPPR
jgi:hypothetical protein